jgi:Uri superfamily endonuclease
MQIESDPISRRLEHRWAKAIARLNETEPVKGFGCSDCGCHSHLFFSAGEPELQDALALYSDPMISISSPTEW